MFQDILILPTHPACCSHGSSYLTGWLSIWLSSVQASLPAPQRTQLWGFCSQSWCTVDQPASCIPGILEVLSVFWCLFRVELLVVLTQEVEKSLMCVSCVFGERGERGRGVVFVFMAQSISPNNLHFHPNFSTEGKSPKWIFNNLKSWPTGAEGEGLIILFSYRAIKPGFLPWGFILRAVNCLCIQV